MISVNLLVHIFAGFGFLGFGYWALKLHKDLLFTRQVFGWALDEDAPTTNSKRVVVSSTLDFLNVFANTLGLEFEDNSGGLKEIEKPRKLKPQLLSRIHARYGILKISIEKDLELKVCCIGNCSSLNSEDVLEKLSRHLGMKKSILITSCKGKI